MSDAAKTPDEIAFDNFVAGIKDLSVDKMHKLYLRTRTARGIATKAYEQQDEKFKRILQAVENHLLAKADTDNVSGYKTDEATSFTAETMKISIADDTAFEAFLNGLPEDQRYSFFERRVSSTHVNNWMKANGGVAPAGLNLFRERTMRFRKANDKGDKDK